MNDAKNILKFWHLMEKPKLVFRSVRLSTGRKESIAEHSWRLALIISIIAPKLKKKINLTKALKMILIHDIGEIKAGDIPSHIHSFDKNIAKLKYKNELEAMKEIKRKYPSFGNDIYTPWCEYEEQKTYESKIVKALDKLDARVQMIDDPKTFKYTLKKISKAPVLTAKTEEFCKIDRVLSQINELSKKERQKKYGF